LAQAEGSPAVAEPLARKAIELGGADQRDAKLLLASLLIGRSAPADARPILAELVAADPHDADALYDQALTDDLGGNYNGAREGYLRALRENPELRAARYNLAVLTLRQGIVQEARHHAQKFAESWPDDPRGGELLRLTGAAAK
jgi:tetratricopeptide (TPR) repeat protein